MRRVVAGLSLLLLCACPKELTPRACGECHTLPQSKTHMLNNGGKYDEAAREWLPPNPTEICSRCHAAGKPVDVDVEHKKSPRFEQ
jgi:hypothetical protein